MEINKTAFDILKEDPKYTLVVVQGDDIYTFCRRGVADLLYLYTDTPQVLSGAHVADKIVGKAAAAFMIMGKIADLTTEKITDDALAMLTGVGIKCKYFTKVPFVANRDNTGRCPLDTICAPLSSCEEMIEAIRLFIDSKNPIHTK